MEHKIGDIVTLPDGRKAEVVKAYNRDCEGCALMNEDCSVAKVGFCSYEYRTDHKDVIFKEIEED